MHYGYAIFICIFLLVQSPYLAFFRVKFDFFAFAPKSISILYTLRANFASTCLYIPCLHYLHQTGGKNNFRAIFLLFSYFSSRLFVSAISFRPENNLYAIQSLHTFLNLFYIYLEMRVNKKSFREIALFYLSS